MGTMRSNRWVILGLVAMAAAVIVLLVVYGGGTGGGAGQGGY